MRVLAISSYGGLGGAELHLEAFLRNRPAGIEAEALLLEDGQLAERLLRLEIPVCVARGQSGRPTPASAQAFSRGLARRLEHHRPNVVWAKGQKAALLAAPACRLRNVPLVWHKVDFSWDRRLAIPLALACDGVIGVSQAVLDPLGPLRRRVLGTVGIPVSLPISTRAPGPRKPVVGTVARLVPYKGIHHMVEAVALLVDEFPEVRLAIVGGPVPEYPQYPQRLLALADDLGVAGRVEFGGFVEDLQPVLERFGVFVSATYRDADGFGFEGLGAACIEASWTGLPVVATRGGGIAEAVLDRRTGTIVQDADPAQLAEAIGRYLRDPALTQRTGAAGMAYARGRFAANVAAARLFELLAKAAR